LFVDDCSLTRVLHRDPTERSDHLLLIDAYEGAEYVHRYSTLRDAKVGGTGTEGQGRGNKQVECYNNTFISSESFDEAQSCTSGTILVHDNLETNYRNGIRIQAYRQFQTALWGKSTGRSPWDENDDFP